MLKEEEILNQKPNVNSVVEITQCVMIFATSEAKNTKMETIGIVVPKNLPLKTCIHSLGLKETSN